MEGGLKVTLPQSGFVQQVIKAGKFTVGCFHFASHFNQQLKVS